MNVAFLVNRTEHASVYYRTLQYVPLLANEGVHSTVITLPKSFNSRRKLFGSLKKYDCVVVQRKLFNLLNFEPLRRAARKLIYDLDDALFVKDSKAEKSFSLTRRLRFARTAKRSDAVICGNEWIREHTSRYNPNCCVIPTAIDTEIYDSVKNHETGENHEKGEVARAGQTHENGQSSGNYQASANAQANANGQANDNREPFRAVWIGGKSTLFYLEGILPALEAAADRIPDFRLRVISDVFPSSETLYIEKVPWSRQTEVQALRECDVGLMPLVDDPWSRGKCGLKLLQYGGVGIPSICSPVGVNTAIVRGNESGLHAQSEKEWQDALITLAENHDLRAQMGRKARQIVDERFSLKACFPKLLSCMRKMEQK